MKTWCAIFAVAILIACPAAFGLPWTYVAGGDVEGRVEKVDNPDRPFVKDYAVVYLSSASGLERSRANQLFKVIQRSGYEASRKTLREGEIVIVLPVAQARKLHIGNRIRITEYRSGRENSTQVLHNASAKEITVIEEAEHVMRGNRRQRL